MKYDISKIRKAMEKSLDPKRFEHTLGVAYTAAALAMCNQVDTEKAIVAGLLHDCAKCMSHEERINYCKKHKLEVSEYEKQNPALLHAKVGADLCKRKYDVEDAEIASAVRYHTTGRPDMTLLEKIIFIADYLEPHRNDAENLPIVRRRVFEDIDLTLRTILADTLEYLKGQDKVIDPMTALTYEYYMNQE